jgi:glyoxylase-like metal-dependent hydrolase (beta-lactamase superfamily II)
MEPLQIDYKIGGSKEIIKIGNGEITGYHCPGHSPGSLVFVLEIEDKRVLFGQDVHGPLDSSLLSNRREYESSLSFMLDLKADILCEGHFGVYQGKDEVDQFIRSFLTVM